MKIKILYLLFFCPLLYNIDLYSQVEKARVAAAYINNFALYTSWNNESLLDSFHVVLFTGKPDYKNQFIELANKRTIKNKPINLKVSSKFFIPKDVQMIILTEDKSEFLLDLYNAVEGKQVLIITEEYKDKHDIMINLYETTDKKLLFEVNNANIINQNLKIDPEILLAGGTEVDVASLYRKAQIILRNMQKSIDLITDSIRRLNENITNSIFQIYQQQNEINEQKKLLNNSNNELTEQSKIIEEHKLILKKQKDSIAYKNSILLNKQKELDNQMRLARKLKISIEEQEQVLKTKQEKIEDLNLEIGNKDLELDYQSEKIVWQERLLFLAIITAWLIIFLFFAIYIGYRNNKKKNQILIKQTKEIEEKLEELKELNLKLLNADQYKSIFLASMSHELRTPLNSIIGYTGILLMGMTGELNEEQKKQLTKVKNNAKHLLSLINDILDISKIEADKVELDCSEFQINDMIKEIIDTIYPRASEKNLELLYDISDNTVLYSDYRRVKQVVLNLAINAVNYSDKGKIQIFTEKIDKNRIRISVKDEGVGIPENELSRLFQPFQQIDSTLTKKNKGTGLGLYLSRKIMKLLDGEIYVKSQLGVGSEFFIEIPVKLIKEKHEKSIDN